MKDNLLECSNVTHSLLCRLGGGGDRKEKLVKMITDRLMTLIHDLCVTLWGERKLAKFYYHCIAEHSIAAFIGLNSSRGCSSICAIFYCLRLSEYLSTVAFHSGPIDLLIWMHGAEDENFYNFFLYISPFM